MGKQESKGKAQSSVEAAASVDAMPKMALAVVEGPKAPEAPAAEATQLALPEPASAPIETPKIELATIEAPRIVPDIDEPNTGAAETVAAASMEDAAAPKPAADTAAEPPSTRGQRNRFALLAASLALAAGVGGMIGALGAASLLRPAPTPIVAVGRSGLEEIQALKENVVQSRVELAAIKATLESGQRGTNAQLTKIGERVDRIERGQAEPVARLSKAVDALERLSRGDNKDLTGTVTQPPAAAAAAAASKPAAVVEGWVVRDVHRGTALLEGRMGLIEVDQGDVVPGLGRVEAIRKQDGRWIVTTSKGTIMPAR
jgi:hypothetical protein